MNDKKLQDEVLCPHTSKVITVGSETNSTCKVRLLSDLHIEGHAHPELYPSQGEDVLVLAGDIHVGAENVYRVLKEFKQHQKNIVYVPGNHEYYGQEYTSTNLALQEYCDELDIHFLNPNICFYTDRLSYQSGPRSAFDGVAIIGCTLWSECGNPTDKTIIKNSINDFRLIRYGNASFTPDIAEKLNDEHTAFIKSMDYKKKLIVTHFLPGNACIDPMYKDEQVLNRYFANNLDYYIMDMENTTWLFGHTHENVDITLGTTRLIANPYGYGYHRHYKERLVEV